MCLQSSDSEGYAIPGSKIKFVDFQEVERIEKQDLDIWNNEAKVEFPYKFIVHTEKRMYEMFAKTKVEQELWVEYLCKIVDLNSGKMIDFNKASEAYQKLNEGIKSGRFQSRCLTKKQDVYVVEK